MLSILLFVRMRAEHPVGDPVGHQVHRTVIGLIEHFLGDLAGIVVVKFPVDAGHGFHLARKDHHVVA